MGREVRQVHKHWEHPKDDDGRFRPLHEGEDVAAKRAAWDAEEATWISGEHPSLKEYPKYVGSRFSEWVGARPDPADYMPNWSEEERTHFQMYETVSEGTPISPVCESPEALARWLADNKASAGPYATATYEQWLRVANGGWAPSMVVANGVIRSGVEALGGD